MKKLLLPAILLFVITVNAQITITSSDLAGSGDSIKTSTGIGFVDPSSTGEDYNWDYSSLIPIAQQFEKFDSPFSFPLPYNLIFNPFTTSFGKDNYQLETIPVPGVTLSAAYDFFKKSTSSYKQIGAGYTLNDIPLPFLYSSSDVIYKFPIDYLNTDSCNYEFGLPIPVIGYYGVKGHRVNTVDGWGTLTTPYGSFSTLRVLSKISSIDSLYIDALSFGTPLPQPLRYEFKWLAPGMKIPVLEIDANDLFGAMVVTNIQYIDSTRAGVWQVGIIENSQTNLNLTVFPNPATDHAVIQYDLTATSHVAISITDVVGKTIALITDQTLPAGIQQQSISAVDLGLASGVYFVNLQTGNTKKIQKILVDR